MCRAFHSLGRNTIVAVFMALVPVAACGGNTDSGPGLVPGPPPAASVPPAPTQVCGNETQSCGGSCVDTASDPHHCGSCTVACDAGQVCVAGSCIVSNKTGRRAAAASFSPSARSVPFGTWHRQGPYIGGRLDGILVDANAYIAVASPGGGFWYTPDIGTTWVEPTSGGANNWGMGDFTLLDLEYDQVNGGVWAVGWNTLHYSSGFGPTWTGVVNAGSVPGSPLPAFSSTGASLHGTDPKPFTQLALDDYGMEWTFYSYGCNGLFYSSDGTNFAQSWPFSGGSSNPDNCISSIAADENTGYVYILTMGMDNNPVHVYQSASPWTDTTPSLTWVAANQGLPAGLPTGTAGVYLTWPPGYSNSLVLVANNGSGPSVWNYNNPPYSCPNLWCPTTTFPGWDARTAYYPGGNDIFTGLNENRVHG